MLRPVRGIVSKGEPSQPRVMEARDRNGFMLFARGELDASGSQRLEQLARRAPDMGQIEIELIEIDHLATG